MRPVITLDKSLYIELLVRPFLRRKMLIRVAEFPSNETVAMSAKMVALTVALVVKVGGDPSLECIVPLKLG